jgi:hypothetical protein
MSCQEQNSWSLRFAEEDLGGRMRVQLRVMRKNEVAIFGRLVAREACFVQRFVARFAVLEIAESPAAGRGT